MALGDTFLHDLHSNSSDWTIFTILSSPKSAPAKCKSRVFMATTDDRQSYSGSIWGLSLIGEALASVPLGCNPRNKAWESPSTTAPMLEALENGQFQAGLVHYNNA